MLKGIFSAVKIVFFVSMVTVLSSLILYASYIYGFNRGSQYTISQIQSELEALDIPIQTKTIVVEKPVPSQNSAASITWTGPELWAAVNRRRREFGVNELASKSELCTIASIRLNELLDLGELDGHEGFSNLAERREDLAWIFEKYTVSEFLLSGATSPQEAVSLWENTLGHKKLLTGGEYVWGCIYAQAGIAVAITAY
jgi:uncharacterized protein YkwD